ncbi:hypothetical protein NDU88_005407 [Pleurodeles waltl]|uniref:Uncharacterized protein n=1 Tax=Pleurodeles waltl TaxID=8319 RepID=A0AAV7TAP9_PLEWA|nr:hypothetical protein NDU88_005407 [Pleurodeles waltl]
MVGVVSTPVAPQSGWGMLLTWRLLFRELERLRDRITPLGFKRKTVLNSLSTYKAYSSTDQTIEIHWIGRRVTVKGRNAEAKTIDFKSTSSYFSAPFTTVT